MNNSNNHIQLFLALSFQIHNQIKPSLNSEISPPPPPPHTRVYVELQTHTHTTLDQPNYSMHA